MLAPAPKRSSIRWRWRALAAALLVGGSALAVLSPDQPRAPGSIAHVADRWLSAHGFGIEQVSLEGHRYTADADLFDALDLGHAGSMLRFDGTAAATRMLQLPWIHRVQILPQVPNGLHVIITERTPYAVWEQGGRHTLIDKAGHRLMVVGGEAFADLPRVRGEGAATAVADLHATLSLFPAIATRLRLAERVGGRRWTLHLTTGTSVQLPAEQDAAALQTLAALDARHRILARDLADIDLRQAAITVRLRHAPANRAISGGGPAALDPQS